MAFSPKGTFLNPFDKDEGINISEPSDTRYGATKGIANRSMVNDMMKEQMQLAELQRQQEMAMQDHRNSAERRHALEMLKHEYPEIYENGQYHGEFDARFAELISHGHSPVEATHRVADIMHRNHRDLERDRISRSYRSQHANPYRSQGSASEMMERMKHGRDELRHRQEMMNDYGQAPVSFDFNKFDALQAMENQRPRAKPKPKKLNFVEQLQADVDNWLDGALSLNHLKGVNLL